MGTSSWHGGKGSETRRSAISAEEEDLRWKLITAGPSEKPKIIKQINILEKKRGARK